MRDPRQIAMSLTAGAAVLPGIALVGWVVGLPVMYGVIGGLTSMRPITAIGLLLTAAALALAIDPNAPPRAAAHRTTSALLGGVAVTLGVMIIWARFGLPLDAEVAVHRLLFVGQSATAPTLPSTISGACFAMLGLAFIGRAIGTPSELGLAFFHATLLMTGYGLVGMLFIATIPETSPFHELSLPAAIAFSALAIAGLYLTPDRGLVGATRRRGASGVLARFSIASAILIPVTVGWARVWTSRLGLLSIEAGIALFAVTMSVSLLVMVWITARAVERADIGAHAILEAAPEAMVVTDSDGSIQRLNGAAERLFGYARTELFGRPLATLLTEGEKGSRKDGRAFEAEIAHAPLRSSQGLLTITSITDVTERRAAVRSLYESEARFRNAFDSAAVGVAIVGLDGSWIRVNAALCTVVGYSEAELRTRTFADITHPDDVDVDLALAGQLLAGEIPHYDLLKRYLHRDGHVVTVQLSASIVCDASEVPLYFVAIVKDVSAEVRARAELAESNVLRAAILESANLSMIATDPAGLILTFNRGAERLLGYTADEMIGRVTPVVFHDAGELASRAEQLARELGRPIEPGFEAFVALARTGTTDDREWTYVRRDGSRVPVRLSITALRAADGSLRGYLGIAADVSEQRKARVAMQESLAEKETLLREIHHRVKNNLQVVSSMLGLEGSGTTDPSARGIFTQARERIRTMAMVHERLYKSDQLTGIPLMAHLAELAELQARAHADTGRQVRVECVGAERFVPVDTAIPVGLIANELIGNAFKHGFAEGRSGRLVVTLEPASPGWLRLGLWNDGAPLRTDAAAVPAASFGLRLVRALLSQVEGVLRVDTASGVLYEITFLDPAARGEAT